MKTTRAVLFGILTVLMAMSAHAQTPAPQTVTGQQALGGQSIGVSPTQRDRRMTPLFVFGGMAVGIWTPVAPPYDAGANRNLAANPL